MLIIMGTFRVAEEHIAALLPLARKVAEETRAEQGCIQYNYAQDIADPALQAALAGPVTALVVDGERLLRFPVG
jgi:hypothetical protein